MAGAASILASFWVAYTQAGEEFGVIFIFAGLVIVMAGIASSMVFFPRTRFSDRVFLATNQKGFKSSGEGYKTLEGAEGIAVTHLRLSGTARINGRKYSVVAEDYVAAGEKVKVAKVEGNRITVKKEVREEEKGV